MQKSITYYKKIKQICINFIVFNFVTICAIFIIHTERWLVTTENKAESRQMLILLPWKNRKINGQIDASLTKNKSNENLDFFFFLYFGFFFSLPYNNKPHKSFRVWLLHRYLRRIMELINKFINNIFYCWLFHGNSQYMNDIFFVM